MDFLYWCKRKQIPSFRFPVGNLLEWRWAILDLNHFYDTAFEISLHFCKTFSRTRTLWKRTISQLFSSQRSINIWGVSEQRPKGGVRPGIISPSSRRGAFAQLWIYSWLLFIGLFLDPYWTCYYPIILNFEFCRKTKIRISNLEI